MSVLRTLRAGSSRCVHGGTTVPLDVVLSLYHLPESPIRCCRDVPCPESRLPGTGLIPRPRILCSPLTPSLPPLRSVPPCLSTGPGTGDRRSSSGHRDPHPPTHGWSGGRATIGPCVGWRVRSYGCRRGWRMTWRGWSPIRGWPISDRLTPLTPILSFSVTVGS